MLGIGILLPAIGVILNKNIGATYPSVLPLLKFIGNPNQVKLIAITMVAIAIIFIVKSFFLGKFYSQIIPFASHLLL